MSNNDTPALVSVDYVLSSYRTRRQKDDRDNEMILQLIYDWLQTMNMFFVDVSGVKAISLTIDPQLNIVNLPSDFIDYYRIGRKISGGFISLSLNPNIAIPLTEECGLQVNTETIDALAIPNWQNYGIGGGYNVANYRIDKRKRQIIFEGVVPGAVCYMEYFSTGISTAQETYFDRRCVEPIIAWLDYQIAINEKSPDLGIKLQTYNDWTIQLNRTMNAIATDEILDAFYRSYRNSIR